MDEEDLNISQKTTYMDLTENSDDEERISEEIEVKDLDRPSRNFGKIGNLRSINELPKKYQCLFEFPFFNVIQSQILDDAIYSDASIVVSSPTGSGKTVVFELAIVKLLMNFEETNFTEQFKIIYVAPIKALCNERLSDWHPKFSNIGLSSIVVTGDSDLIDFRCISNYNIIITTPEKWDSLSRNMKSDDFDSIKLFMIDEIHLLNEESRGPILEAIVSRMKIWKKQEKIRFIAVSATIPNIEDIAEWLGYDKKPAVYFKIGEELRPVQLKKVVFGYPCPSGITPFKFDINLNYKLQSIIMEYSNGKPTLIFCNTRKGVEMTAKHISQDITFHLTPAQSDALFKAAQTMYETKMKQQLLTGVGCHHAGMTPANRLTIEELFRSGNLPVLVTTSTLAMGINLPAHLVIIKNTKHYVNGQFQDYTESSLLQMIGRAGRPQFDQFATVVILTNSEDKNRYEKILGGKELIESNLHRHLTEYLNAEVVLRVITDIAVALEWLQYTFLYVRVFKNPKHYNMPTNCSKDKIDKKLQDLCQIEINILHKYGLLQIDQTDGFSLYPTSYGLLMATYYIDFNTYKLFGEITGNESLSDLLVIVSKCEEFSESFIRVTDKKTLNTLNKCKTQIGIRFPLPGSIKTTYMKVNCLIQATFGCLRIQSPALEQEASKIIRIGERIIKCIVTYLSYKNTHFTALLNALILNQCFNSKLWENSTYVSRQLNKIGNVMSSMLVAAGKTTFKSILDTNPRDLERIINRVPPLGNEIHESVSHLPFYKLDIEPVREGSQLSVKVTVTLTNSEAVAVNCTAGGKNCMNLLVGDTTNKILFSKKLFHNSMALSKEFVKCIIVDPKEDYVVLAHLISENWAGIDCCAKYNLSTRKDAISTPVVTIDNKEMKDMKTRKSSDITSYFKASKKGGVLKNTPQLTTPKVAKPTLLDLYLQKTSSKKNIDLECIRTPHIGRNDDSNKNNNKSFGNSSTFNKKDNLNQSNSIYQASISSNANKFRHPYLSNLLIQTNNHNVSSKSIKTPKGAIVESINNMGSKERSNSQRTPSFNQEKGYSDKFSEKNSNSMMINSSSHDSNDDYTLSHLFADDNWSENEIQKDCIRNLNASFDEMKESSFNLDVNKFIDENILNKSFNPELYREQDNILNYNFRSPNVSFEQHRDKNHSDVFDASTQELNTSYYANDEFTPADSFLKSNSDSFNLSFCSQNDKLETDLSKTKIRDDLLNITFQGDDIENKLNITFDGLNNTFVEKNEVDFADNSKNSGSMFKTRNSSMSFNIDDSFSNSMPDFLLERSQNYLNNQTLIRSNLSDFCSQSITLNKNKKTNLDQRPFESFSQHLARKFNTQEPQISNADASHSKILDVVCNNKKHKQQIVEKGKVTKCLSQYSKPLNYKQENTQKRIGIENLPQFLSQFSKNSRNQFNHNKSIELEINKTINDDIKRQECSANVITSESRVIKLKKPAFVKNYAELTENYVKKLKQKTLVNDYFNFDIGFQEFLSLSPDGNSETENNKPNKNEKESVKTTLVPTTQSYYCKNNQKNITNYSSEESSSINYSPETENNTLSISQTNDNSLSLNFGVQQNSEENTETSENESIEIRTKGRLKIMERFYESTEINKDTKILSRNYEQVVNFSTQIPNKKIKISENFISQGSNLRHLYEINTNIFKQSSSTTSNIFIKKTSKNDKKTKDIMRLV